MRSVAAIAIAVALCATAGGRSAHALPSACWQPDTSVLAKAQSVGETAQRSVVVVEARGASAYFSVATGWFVSRDLVMTNAHVVAGATSVTVYLIDGRSVQATVVASTATPDVALLRMANPPADVVPLPLGSSKSLKSGEPLVAVGHPVGVGFWVVSLGIFRARQLSPRGGSAFDLASTVPSLEGSSGSPVLDLEGKVVGMDWGGSRAGGTDRNGNPIAASKQIRTYFTPENATTLAVPIEDALAVARSNSLLPRVASRVGAVPLSGRRKPPGRPPPRPAPPKLPSLPAAEWPCVPSQGGGWDAATLSQGQTAAATVRSSVVVVDSAGTGWFIAPDLIVTNNHVVEGEASTTVRLFDGRSMPARVVGRSSTPDVAFLRIDAPAGVASLPLGDSTSLQPGQPLVAVGHPTVIGFWIASIGRLIRLDRIPASLVSSVPSLPGSSGSPILDLAGRVVGMVYGGEPETPTATYTPASPDPHTYFVAGGDTLAVPVEDIVNVGHALGVFK